MKTLLLAAMLLAACVFMAISTFGQGAAVNSDGTAPDNSAMLDVKSTSKGMLVPRMTSAQRAAISEPATGLLVYQTDGVAGFYYNTGTSLSPNWVVLASAAAGGTTQWLYNGTQIYYDADDVGIGVSNPVSRLHVRHNVNNYAAITIENTDVGSGSSERISFNNEEGYSAGIATYDVSSTYSAAMDFFNNRSGANMRFTVASAPRMYIANNGNVGIGTSFTSPAGLLHLRGAEWSSRPVIIENTTTGNVGPSIRFTGESRTYDIIGATGGGATSGSGYFAIYDNTAGAYRMVVSPAGTIGIGTSTPFSFSRLHLQTSTETYGMYVQNTYTGNAGRYGIYAISNNNPGYGYGIRTEGGYMGGYFEAFAFSSASTIYGVYAIANGAGGSGTRYGVYGYATGGTNNYGGYFNGNVHVTGTLSKAAGTFKIDHPLDPENKYLSHSFVESPDMMNVYTGNVTTDASGVATAQLPAYFEKLNINYTYQLTVIGQFAQAIVSEEIRNNEFVIKTDKPNVKVSWQVTGVRNDPYAQQHRVVPEEAKKADERGKYLYPEGYNASQDKMLNPPPTKK